MKKIMYVLGGLVVVAIVLAIIGSFVKKNQDEMSEETQETPVVLAQVDISGGFRMVDAQYITARRVYSNGVVLQKTNDDQLSIFKELSEEELSAYQALLERYAGPESVGTAKADESCPSFADGIDYSFTFPTKSEEAVSNCKYELDLSNPLLAPLVEEDN